MSRDERILIVEDDVELIDMLSQYLAQRGYQVESASLGQDALERALSFMPHVVLLDVTLPDIDGFEVCSRLRRQPRTAHIPVLFLTDRARRSDRLTGLNIGADDYITKPFDMDELYLRIRNAVDHLSRGNAIDPITGLPTGSVLRRQMADAVVDPQMGVLRLVLRYAWAFRDKYGPLAFADVRRYLAQLLMGALALRGGPEDFIGVANTDTVIVLGLPAHLNEVGHYVAERFNATAHKHYAMIDLYDGYLDLDGRQVPVMRLVYQVITGEAKRELQPPG